MIFFKNICVLLITILLSFSSYSQQISDIQYVTGKLRLSLYAQADSGSEVVKLLASGDKLDVLEIAGPYARVKTTGNKEGWVKRGFLVKSKPAIILYNEVNAAYEELQQQMQDYKEKNKAISSIEEQLHSLEKENDKLTLANNLLQKKIKPVKTETTEKPNNDNIDLSIFKQFIIEYKFYLLGILILLILLGYRVGEIVTENKVKKHFGGLKVW